MRYVKVTKKAFGKCGTSDCSTTPHSWLSSIQSESRDSVVKRESKKRSVGRKNVNIRVRISTKVESAVS